jgi:hypothetical protein
LFASDQKVWSKIIRWFIIKSFSYVRIFVDVLSTNGSLVENQDGYCFLKGIIGKVWILKVATVGFVVLFRMVGISNSNSKRKFRRLFLTQVSE